MMGILQLPSLDRGILYSTTNSKPISLDKTLRSRTDRRSDESRGDDPPFLLGHQLAGGIPWKQRSFWQQMNA